MSKKVFISPRDKEVIDCLFKAACTVFEIDKAQLMNDMSGNVVNIRHIVIYLISTNTGLNKSAIAAYLEKRPYTIQKAIEKIDVHKIIYWQTVGDMNAIIQCANNFEKLHCWNIHLIERRN